VEPQFSPGSTFWLPHGTRIYNKLMAFIRNEYINFGFTEVITPNMFNNNLWTTSGHFPKYEKDMFLLEVDKDKYALKPMNCPGHCLMFRHLPRSHKELPVRFADFGVLHRNEDSGALKGLTRVRRFQQDDGHIFCAEEDVMSEVANQLEFMKKVYGVFGYSFSMNLSTRPDNYLGEIEVWDKAEKALEDALNNFGHKWGKDVGGGAFYGPKIDVQIHDALGRSHQCATVQLDFQLPIRFGLEFAGKEKNKTYRPVIIHRAIYGSLERFIGILIEHLEGKWPLWLSPRQLMVVPVTKKFNDYAESVKETLVGSGYFAEVDLSGKTLDKKVLEHSLYNYILVVGATEEQNKTVNVRKRKEKEDEVQVGRDREVPLHDFIKEMDDLCAQHK
jgi:threonyl-tRNA synthetase